MLCTGSSRGIGKEIALSFAKSGANVAITGRSQSEVNKTTEEVQKVLQHGARAIGMVADGCKRTDLEMLVEKVWRDTAALPSNSR